MLFNSWRNKRRMYNVGRRSMRMQQASLELRYAPTHFDARFWRVSWRILCLQITEFISSIFKFSATGCSIFIECRQIWKRSALSFHHVSLWNDDAEGAYEGVRFMGGRCLGKLKFVRKFRLDLTHDVKWTSTTVTFRAQTCNTFSWIGK